MARAFTFYTGQFANGDTAVLIDDAGPSWTIHANGNRTRIARGSMAGWTRSLSV